MNQNALVSTGRGLGLEKKSRMMENVDFLHTYAEIRSQAGKKAVEEVQPRRQWAPDLTAVFTISRLPFLPA